MSTRTDVVNLQVNINGNQAQKNLGELRKKAADINFEMKGLVKGTAEYVAKSKELSAIDSEMDRLKKTIGLTSLSLKELRKEQASLNSLKSSSIPLSKEYKEYDQKLVAVTKRIAEVKSGMTGFQASFSSAAGAMKGFGAAALGYLGLQSIGSALQNIVGANSKLSDQLADVQRVANLTKIEANELLMGLSKLDTRTSTDGLLNIAIVAGKLGVAKEDILDFTKATDMLVVALGDELGDADQITSQLGKILNVFEGEVTADSLAKLGNAIVDMANKGIASGSFVVDFTQRMAGIAKTANLALPDVLALAGGIEEMGGRSESSSTAVINLINSIAQDVPKAARIAGAQSAKEVEAFTKLFAEKPAQALLKYSQGLVKNKESFAEVAGSMKEAGEEGVRVISSIGLLGNNAEKLTQKMIDTGQAIQQTTKIEEAFALKNATLGAEIEKTGKRIAAFFTDSAFSDSLAKMIRGFNDLTSSSRSLADEFKDQAKVVNNLEKEVSPLLTRYDQLVEKANQLGDVSKLSGDEQKELNSIISTVASTIPTAITQFDLYGNAMGISSERAREFIETQKAILKIKNEGALKDLQKQIKEQERLADLTARGLNRRDAQGNVIIDKTYAGAGGASATVTLKATPEEIKAMQEGQKAIQDRLKGLRGLHAELSGENLKIAATVDKNTSEMTGAVNNTISAVKLKLEASIKALDEAYGKLDSTNKKGIAANRKSREDLQKQLDALEGRASSKSQSQKEGDKKFNEEKRLKEKIHQDQQKLNELLVKSTVDSYAKEVSEAKTKYNEMVELAHGNKDQLVQIEKLWQQEMLAIQDKYLNEAFTRGEITRAQYVQKSFETLVKLKKEITNKDLQEHLDSVADDLSGIAQREVGGTRASKELKALTSKGRERRKALLDLLEFERQAEVANANLTREQVDLINEKYRQKGATVVKESFIKTVGDIVEFTQQALQILDTFGQARTNRENAELNRDRILNDKKKANLDKQLKGKLISQHQFNREVERLDEEFDNKRKALEVRQFKRKQKADIAQGLINGAQAALKTLAEFGAPIPPNFLGMAAMAFNVAATIASIAAIKSAKPPEGRKGLIVPGPSHEQGGVDLVERNTGKTLANVEGGEPLWVFSKNTYRNNKTVLDALMRNSLFRNGASIMPSFKDAYIPINTSRLVPMMKDGGIVNSNARLSDQDELTLIALNSNRTVQELAELRSDMNSWNRELTAKVSLRDLNEQKELLHASKKASGMNQ